MKLKQKYKKIMNTRILGSVSPKQIVCKMFIKVPAAIVVHLLLQLGLLYAASRRKFLVAGR